MAAVAGNLNLDGAAFIHGMDTVADQIEHDLPEMVAIEPERGCETFVNQPNLFCGQLFPVQNFDLLYHFIQMDILRMGRNGTAVLQILSDLGFQALHLGDDFIDVAGVAAAVIRLFANESG